MSLRFNYKEFMQQLADIPADVEIAECMWRIARESTKQERRL